ncbi:REP-associated tyrosine transposase [Persicobacter diffluens]|uniref:Transposase n=1 Tax=Persicobacter diffluens TaxID=981 RepID=A0AAN4W4P2_9BACT|nr:transposase [Persicobacter diffluens]
MGRKYQIVNDEYFYFLTFTTVYWLDIFSREIYSQILIDSLRYCQREKGLKIGAFCVMPSHVHFIWGCQEQGTLSGIIRDFKKYTSNRILKEIQLHPQERRREWLLWMRERAAKKNSRNKNYQFWQQHNHPIELNTNDKIDSRLHYIHNNPVEAGLVYEATAWKYSSASAYAGRESLLDLIYLT